MRKDAQHRTARNKPAYHGKPLAGRGQMVLVVDDDESALSAIARLIRSAGFTVRTFSHPKELLSEQLPDRNACLVADIYLPEMNGVELCHTLAVTDHALPTILITGRNDEMTRRLVENSEAITVLFKPIDEVPLFDAITRCLNLEPENPA